MSANVELTPRTFVVSDIHLAIPGQPLNNFVSPAEFVRLLSERIPTLSGGMRSTLVILGDFVDFARLEPWLTTDEDLPRHVGGTEEHSIAKLVKAAGANQSVFRALGEFADRNQLIVVPGNHDADMFWPGVQQAFRDALGEGGAQVTFADAWTLEASGVLFTHGHQYSYENRFYAGPPPFVDYNGSRRLERCWGTFFLETVYNLIEYFAPYANKVHPELKAAVVAMPHLKWDEIPPPLGARLLAFMLRHGWRVVADALMDASGGDRAKSVDELLRLVPIQAPDAILRQAESIVDKDRQYDGGETGTSLSMLSLPDPPRGTLGRTATRSFTNFAWKQLARPDLFAAIFGHTHRASGPESRDGIEGALVNSGTWTGTLILDDSRSYTHEELVAAAGSPLTKLTVVDIDVLRRSVERLEI